MILLLTDIFKKNSWHTLGLYHTILTLNDPGKGTFKNIVGKGENAGIQHFLLSHNVKKKILFVIYIYFVVCKSFEFGQVSKSWKSLVKS